MKYAVTVGGLTFEVAITTGGVTVDGEPVEAGLEPIGAGVLHRLTFDGVTRVVAIAGEGGAWTVHDRGETWGAAVVDQRRRELRAVAGAAAGAESGAVIRAPMPGLVLRVTAEPGASVTADLGVVVLEAMKMENEIRAGRDGVVERVFVEPGTAVEKNAPLVQIAPSVDRTD